MQSNAKKKQTTPNTMCHGWSERFHAQFISDNIWLFACLLFLNAFTLARARSLSAYKLQCTVYNVACVTINQTIFSPMCSSEVLFSRSNLMLHISMQPFSCAFMVMQFQMNWVIVMFTHCHFVRWRWSLLACVGC